MTRRLPFFAFLFALALGGQQSQQAERPPYTTFRSDTQLVVLNISVLDAAGNIVKGLPQSAFTVYEDDVKQTIAVFRQEDVPVSLGLVIDNSASMVNKHERVATASLALVKASNPQDEVFVIHFSEEANVTQEFTSDIGKLERSLRNIKTNGETAMRDALLLGVEHLRHRGSKDKKVLLVVTDGDDNSSVEKLPHLLQAAHQNNVIVYGVGLLAADDPRRENAKAAVNELTLATGGRAWFPANVTEIEKIAPEIAHEIRNQYVLGYTSKNEAEDGSFRRVRVEVSAPGVTVRTRSGYYAPRR
jgi:Ca-activated chloride channel family protein